MHRFRKKSDAKRSDVSAAGIGVALSTPQPFPYPIVTQEVQVYPPPLLPALPPISDFRTSLILPDLTRRFTLLQSSGAPVSLDDLKSRFAQQRAKGAEHQISEEEEDMLLDMLSRIRAQNTGGRDRVQSDSGSSTYVKSEPPSAGYTTSEFGRSTGRQSTQSTTTLSSGIAYDSPTMTGSPSSRASKRHSNNLFAGQFRDMRYMRKASTRTMGSNRSVLSASPSESTTGSTANALIDSYADSFRPVTPENTTPSVSATSSPSIFGTPTQSTVISQLSLEDGLGPLGRASTSKFGKHLSNLQLKRMSISLEEVIREIEEEADDEVLVPRSSTSTQRPLSNSNATEVPKSFAALTTDDDDSNVLNAITDGGNESWRADVDRPGSAGGHRSPSPYRAGGSTSPVPRVPGYIPGMPRPVTPAREMDLDDVRSHSTTPRAASPTSYAHIVTTAPLAISASTLHRGTSSASTIPARPTSPLSPTLITQRNHGGGSNADERYINGITATDYAQSPVSSWRRPSSPLSNSVFQSLNGGSRPSTPSNVTWNVPPKASPQASRPLGRNGTLLGHVRNHSSTSVTDSQDKADNSVSDSSKSSIRTPRSPYSPLNPDDSPLEGKGKSAINGASYSSSTTNNSEADSPPGSSKAYRSSTPRLDAVRSPSSPSFNEDRTRRNERVLSPLLTPPTSPFASNFLTKPLYVAPMSNNSSRSSLVSAGSSYHSWEEEHGFGTGFIDILGKTGPSWHDVTTPEVNNRPPRVGSRNHVAADDPESILRQFTGLSKLDLLSIQSKLLEAAHFRAKNIEPRSPSTLRRRRPSTAQSVHSLGGQQSRTTSPAPQITSSPSAHRAMDSAAKANALLDSVVDSIHHPPLKDGIQMGSERTVVGSTSPVHIETSSPGRRNKDLTDILFGGQESEPVVIPPEPITEAIPQINTTIGDEEDDPIKDYVNISQPALAEVPLGPPPPMETNQRRLSPNEHANDPMDLLRQVQERTEAAMAQLHRSPQQPRSPIMGNNIIRKRINLQDISSPLLVQSSTSIDKIPTVPTSPQLNSSQVNINRSSTSKLSFSKRLRNTLRSKPAQPNGEEVTPWTGDNSSSMFNSSPRVDNRSLTPSKYGIPSPGSTLELGIAKPPSVSPPASAGPSLKSFMSRFRKKSQPETPLYDLRNGSSTNQATYHPSVYSVDREHIPSMPLSAPPQSYDGSFPRGLHPDVLISPSLSRQPTETPTIVGPAPPSPLTSQTSPSDPAALVQFYEAGKNIGLDQGTLNEIIALSQQNPMRSSELTSASASVTRNNSVAARSVLDTPREISSPFGEMTPVPEVYIERPSDLARKASQRQYANSPPPAPRRVREIANAHANIGNAVVRRTLIFPSANGSNTDLSSLVRKASKNRKRVSNLSVQSNRSVHDRVPTPPPLKAKRQSMDPSPPVPTLPSAWTNQGSLAAPRQFPETATEKSNSLYDSLYDMYAGDKLGSTQGHDQFEPPKSPTVESMPDTEGGQALELIEMANGETIWSIVNGLRADDTESLYPSRTSMDSEFSGGAHDADSEQLFFKEHTRNASKGSNTSNIARRKPGSQAANRPETKVFYSSSAHIARLIDQLSRSADAGSFNIKPKQANGTGHSHSGSFQSDVDSPWTVEERLEHMLGTLNTTI